MTALTSTERLKLLSLGGVSAGKVKHSFDAARRKHGLPPVPISAICAFRGALMRCGFKTAKGE